MTTLPRTCAGSISRNSSYAAMGPFNSSPCTAPAIGTRVAWFTLELFRRPFATTLVRSCLDRLDACSHNIVGFGLSIHSMWLQ